MDRLLIGLLSLAVAFVLVPTAASAQSGGDGPTCWAHCDDCSGGGHSYGVAGSPMKGRDAHGCGGNDCETAHQPCDDQLEEEEQDAEELGLMAQRVLDAERLQQFEQLNGSDLFEIIARSEGTMFINWERGAFQQTACSSSDDVIFHLRLSDAQLTEFAEAEAEAQENAPTL